MGCRDDYIVKVAELALGWANALRGSMDASRYMDYMLGLLFYKFLSEKTIEGFKAATRCQGTMDEVLTQYAQMFETRGG